MANSNNKYNVVLLWGARGSAVVRALASQQCSSVWPWFKFRCRRHMWVEFVVGSFLCSERFFSGYSGFPLSSKTIISKFQFDQQSGRRRTSLWMCFFQIINYYLFYLLFTIGCGRSRWVQNDFKLAERKTQGTVVREKNCKLKIIKFQCLVYFYQCGYLFYETGSNFLGCFSLTI